MCDEVHPRDIQEMVCIAVKHLLIMKNSLIQEAFLSPLILMSRIQIVQQWIFCPYVTVVVR